jgi:hypothetical protein
MRGCTQATVHKWLWMSHEWRIERLEPQKELSPDSRDGSLVKTEGFCGALVTD